MPESLSQSLSLSLSLYIYTHTCECPVCCVVAASYIAGPQGKKVTKSIWNRIFGAISVWKSASGPSETDSARKIVQDGGFGSKIGRMQPHFVAKSKFQFVTENQILPKLDLVTFFPGRGVGAHQDADTNGTFPYIYIYIYIYGRVSK